MILLPCQFLWGQRCYWFDSSGWIVFQTVLEKHRKFFTLWIGTYFDRQVFRKKLREHFSTIPGSPFPPWPLFQLWRIQAGLFWDGPKICLSQNHASNNGWMLFSGVEWKLTKYLLGVSSNDFPTFLQFIRQFLTQEKYFVFNSRQWFYVSLICSISLWNHVNFKPLIFYGKQLHNLNTSYEKYFHVCVS